MAQTSRISIKSNAIIHEIVALTGKPKIEIIEQALENYYHQERMRLFNDAYKNLKSNKKTWKRELEERNVLEGTIKDGFED